jgi:hypothetical protein
MNRVISLTLAATFVALVLMLSASHLTHTTALAQGQSQDHAGGAPEIIPHRINAHGAGTGYLTAGTTRSLSPIKYHGGPLINTPSIFLIWYGNWNQTIGTDTSSGQQIIRDFSNAIGGSNYFNINMLGYNAGGYTISGNVAFGGETTTTGYPYGTSLADASILSIVNDAITSGRVPYDANGVYFVLTSSDVTESSGFCTQYCGWHTAGTPSAGHVRYAFIGNAARCLNACAAQTTGPNGNAGVDGMVSIMAHELEESTTDPDPRSGWADGSGAENGDKCAWTFGSRQFTAANGAIYNMTMSGGGVTRNYLIQRNLAAVDNKCYTDYINRFQ